MKFNRFARTASQLLFLALFIVLYLKGKTQAWMMVFALGIVVSFFAGRWYCGWACQMGTLLRGISWLKRTLKIPQIKAPAVAKKPLFRIVSFIILFAAMFIMQKNGLQRYAILGMTGLSVLVTLFFHESFWHASLCPYGSILSVTTRASRLKVSVSEDACIACGKCQRACPTVTVRKADSGKWKVTNSDCLNCGQCMDACPVHAINYGA